MCGVHGRAAVGAAAAVQSTWPCVRAVLSPSAAAAAKGGGSGSCPVCRVPVLQHISGVFMT